MNSANMPQDVFLYYKNSPAATNVQSLKIQTGFSLQTTLHLLLKMPISRVSRLHLLTTSRMSKSQSRILLKVLQGQINRRLCPVCSVTLRLISRMGMKSPRMQPSSTLRY
uniref:Uncharacterized protein n=1 Tax=Helianthus annuus TaxID=4232 RepID=A0A251RS92_HELAN